MNRIASGLACALLLATHAATAQQQGFALDSYEPVAPQSEWFEGDSLDFRGHQRFGVGLLTAWAHKPLVLYDQTGAAYDTLVQDQVMVHLGLQFLWLDRIRLAVNIPFGLYQGGDSADVAGRDYPAPSAGALADPRLSGDVRLFGEYRSPITMALGADVHLPLGSRSAYTGDGRVRIGAHLRAAGELDTFTPLAWSASVGYQYRRLRDPFIGLEHDNIGSLDLTAGARLADAKLLVGPEFHIATQLGSSHSAFDTDSTPAEVLLGAHYRIAEQFDLGAGFGVGVTQGVGAPTFRALLQLAWSPRLEPEPAPLPPPALVCPPPPPPPVCEPPPPPCPDCPKPEAKPEPEQPPPPLPQPAPPVVKKVTITGTQIVIPHQIKFRLNSADLVPSDDPLLTEVAKVIQEHPEVGEIRVEGHTDSAGQAAHNLELSKRRAKSVLDWLVAHGTPRERLSSEGYGDTRPLVPNDTADHRALNRRVEFHLARAESTPAAPATP